MPNIWPLVTKSHSPIHGTENRGDECVLRKYRTEDLEDVLTAWETASAVAHPFLSSEFQAKARHEIANVYLPITETWVWETDERVVGFLSLLGNEIGGFFVTPKYHGMGIGRSLMDHARELRAELEVEVFKANAIGRAFYEKYGFELIQERIHDETGLDLLRLRLLTNKPLKT